MDQWMNEKAREIGARGGEKTYCLYNDERNHVVDNDFVSSSWLKNWSSFIIIKGGGLLETTCNKKPSYLFEGVYFKFFVNLFI